MDELKDKTNVQLFSAKAPVAKAGFVLIQNIQFTPEFFDEASAAWRLNKKEIKHTGNFIYIKNRCSHIKKDNKQCENECKPYSNVCKYH